MVKPVTSRESVQPAGAYHAVHLTEDPARALVWRAIADHLAPWVSPDSHALEIGAGYCCWINAVRAKRKVAVDIWPDMPAMLLRAWSRYGSRSNDLPSLGHEVFDVVLASNVIEHFVPETASDIVGNVAALLKPGGRFHRHPAKLSIRFSTLLRRLYTPIDLHRCVAFESLEVHGFSSRRRNPGSCRPSMRGARAPSDRGSCQPYLRSPFRPLGGTDVNPGAES